MRESSSVRVKKFAHFLGITWQDALIAFLAVFSFIIFVPVFTYAYFAHDLDSRDKILNAKSTGLTLLDDQNKPFFTFYQAKYEKYIPLSQIPKVTQESVIASEDKGFYSHPGFSIDAIIRAVFTDLSKGGLVEGGSTLTQQLVKNSLLTNNKNFLRKYQEIVLAAEIERRYSKDQILEMYLNSVYFGQGAFGIQEAAQAYFGKDAKDLDLAQSALLTALLPAPSELSPIDGNKDLAILHQHTVLEKMYQQHYITADQLQSAESEQLAFGSNTQQINNLAPHFALMVKDELVQKYGEEEVARSGFLVHTTLNSAWQQYAEQVVKNQVANLKRDNVSNGAVVVMDPKNGEIKALVGSVDWYNPQFGKVNIATSLRQPGSSFKPIVYSDALEQRIITPATILQDVPTTFNQCQCTPNPTAPGCLYSPHDYDNKFWGPVTVRRALTNSRNVPAVEVMQKIGVPSAVDMAHQLGITTLNDPTQYGLSLALGAGEVRLVDLVDVYSVFADGGNRNDPTMITSIDDKYGNEVYHYQPQPQEVLDPGVAFLISSILADNKTRAEEFGTALNISRQAAVKTGTTENYVDALTVGYTPDLVVGVWVGNNDDTPMDQIAGSLGAAPIWRALMEHYLLGTPVHDFQPPDDVVSWTGCTTSFNPHPSASVSPNPSPSASASVSATVTTIKEYFLKGTEPTQNCRPVQVFTPPPPPTVTAPPPPVTPSSSSSGQGNSGDKNGNGNSDHEENHNSNIIINVP